MPKASVGQTGFQTGEVSPLFYGATDNQRYKKGLDTCYNWLPTLQGPLIRRPGTKYVNNVKDSANPPVLIPFNFSATQNYILEFGNQYIRFYANNGQVLTSGTSYQVQAQVSVPGQTPFLLSSTNTWATRADTNPLPNEIVISSSSVASGSILELVSPYVSSQLKDIRYSQEKDVLYLFHSAVPTMKLQRYGQTYWTLSQVMFQDGPYFADNSVNSVGDLVNVQVKPLVIRTNAQNDIITNPPATVSNMVTDPGGSGQIQVTTSAAHGFNNGQYVFITGVVGTTEANNFSLYTGRVWTSTTVCRWKIRVISTTSFLLLGSTFTNAYTSGGQVYPAIFRQIVGGLGTNDFRNKFNFNLIFGGKRYWGIVEVVYDCATAEITLGGNGGTPINFPSSTVSDSWQIGSFTYENGYPSCGTFHQNRLNLAGVPNYPQTLYGSETGLYESFAPSDPTTLVVAENNAYQFTLNSEDSNVLRWLKSTAQGLLAASYSSEWAVTPSGNSEAITPVNFNAQQTSFYGSAAIDAVKIGNAVLYVQRAYRKLREMAYFFTAGTFRSNDLTEISEHITLPQLTKILVQKENQPLIWGIRSDGALLSLIYNRDDASLSAGWARHFLGGKSDSFGNPAMVYDFSIIADPTAAFDQMWLVVKRYINGATVYTIEYMTKINDSSIAQSDSFQLDCGATYSGAPATTISGLNWLEGETVSVLTDGGLHPDCVVTSGTIHLNYSASKVQVGYSYKSQGKVLRAEAGSPDGTSIGKTRRTTRAAIQLYRAGDLAIGTDFSNLIPFEFMQADQNMADTAVPLYSGIYREGLESAYDFESQLCFEASSPLPCTIQSITTFMEEQDV